VGDIAIPYLFAALMAIEYGYNTVRRNGHQTPRDSAVSLMVAIPHFATLTILPVAWVVLYREVSAAVPWRLPDAWWTWPLGIVAMDLAAYWMHRYHHALNLTWGIHSVHHSSDEFTMTTGGRSSLAEPLVNVVSGAYLILVAPALLGLPVAAAALGWLVKDTWGFAVHTRNVRRLGVLEAVLATPSHHRVHHAIDPIYAGKNYGFVFIVWDKLFGTFQPELDRVPPTFGTHRPPRSFHPLAVAFHELRLIYRDAAATVRWRDKLRIWFMPAGWRPADLPPDPAAGHARHEPPAPRGLYVIGGLQLALLLASILHLGLTVGAHGAGADLAYLAFFLLGTYVSGEYFDRTRRYVASELARALAIAAMLAGTGAWFGRPLDGLAAVLIALAGANLAAALVWAQLGRRLRASSIAVRAAIRSRAS
jgi:sterol desaturase/sphingolipid hydroxylase (fatty acid hydroxylase superfamily)